MLTILSIVTKRPKELICSISSRKLYQDTVEHLDSSHDLAQPNCTAWAAASIDWWNECLRGIHTTFWDDTHCESRERVIGAFHSQWTKGQGEWVSRLQQRQKCKWSSQKWSDRFTLIFKNLVKMTILPKSIYSLKGLPIKFPARSFKGTNKSILKLIWKDTEARRAHTILKTFYCTLV